MSPVNSNRSLKPFMSSMSNELKAVVVLENVIDNPKNVLKENSLTVQKFDYDCVRKRNESGEIYGGINPVKLSFTVRVENPRHAMMFFKGLATNETMSLSFLFNVTYNSFQRMSDYEDGMVVTGYLVSAEEVFKTEPSSADQNQQLLLDVKMLVKSVTYLGIEEKNSLNGIFVK